MLFGVSFGAIFIVGMLFIGPLKEGRCADCPNIFKRVCSRTVLKIIHTHQLKIYPVLISPRSTLERCAKYLKIDCVNGLEAVDGIIMSIILFCIRTSFELLIA